MARTSKYKLDKTVDYSKDIEPLSKNVSWAMQYENEAMLYQPGKDAWRQRLCITMRIWSDKEDSLEVQDFCDEYKINYKTLSRWATQYPDDVGVAYENMKRSIGARRRKGCHMFKYKAETCYKDMHNLVPEWAVEVDQYHANLKKLATQEPQQNITLNIKEVKDTGRIKPK